MIFYFILNSKMDKVKEDLMFKTHNKRVKGVLAIATIVQGIFMCHCVQNTLRIKDESHVGFLMESFFLLPTWRHLEWAEWENAIHVQDISEPIGTLPSATADHVWEYNASKRLTNLHKGIAWMAIQGGLPVRAFMHARGLNQYKSCLKGSITDEASYHLFWECTYTLDLLKALSIKLAAWIPTSCIIPDSIMYGLFPGMHTLRDLQDYWRLLCCFKDVLLFSRNQLVIGKKETSTLTCRKMIQNLLRDYAALDRSDNNSDDGA
ncbi:hypothetical protein NDU88_001817 [Pleurodeles waltl]|uniref:Reverse transcriptase zinc-binding domain-containing protein n=1 Tax=Pleurodeles waltl TaxID=8319 RepID=A0AAV7V8U4_PLEWA|nr:hypothetical protein NDU88_001817 [Pleurodeles waltl]